MAVPVEVIQEFRESLEREAQEWLRRAEEEMRQEFDHPELLAILTDPLTGTPLLCHTRDIGFIRAR